MDGRPLFDCPSFIWALCDDANLASGMLKAQLLELFNSAFYFIRPQKIQKVIHRMILPSVCVPTHTLRALLAEALQKEPHATKLDFFRVLGSPDSEGTRQTAHDIYKSWLHSFLSTQGMTMQCEWLVASGLRGTKTRTQVLQGTPAVMSTPQDAPAAPFYWIPTTGNFPDIDSALILKKEIVAIRVCIGDRHRPPPEKGLT